MNKMRYIQGQEFKKLEKIKKPNYSNDLKAWLLTIDGRVIESKKSIYNKEFSLPPVKYIGDVPDKNDGIKILLRYRRFQYLEYFLKWFIVPLGIAISIAVFLHFKTMLSCSLQAKIWNYSFFSFIGFLPWVIYKDAGAIIITEVIFGVALGFTALFLGFNTWKTTDELLKDYEFHKFKSGSALIWKDEFVYSKEIKFWNFDSTKQKIVYKRTRNYFNRDSADPNFYEITSK